MAYFEVPLTRKGLKKALETYNVNIRDANGMWLNMKNAAPDSEYELFNVVTSMGIDYGVNLKSDGKKLIIEYEKYGAKLL